MIHWVEFIGLAYSVGALAVILVSIGGVYMLVRRWLGRHPEHT